MRPPKQDMYLDFLPNRLSWKKNSIKFGLELFKEYKLRDTFAGKLIHTGWVIQIHFSKYLVVALNTFLILIYDYFLFFFMIELSENSQETHITDVLIWSLFLRKKELIFFPCLEKYPISKMKMHIISTCLEFLQQIMTTCHLSTLSAPSNMSMSPVPLSAPLLVLDKH